MAEAIATIGGTSNFIRCKTKLTRFSGQYLMPVDSKEQERLDIMHTMILAARPKPQRLHHAPYTERIGPERREPPRVLDLGHGTAMWLIDMQQKYQSTEFHGLDMAHMAPRELPPNIDLYPDIDYESPWALGENSFDLIHLQMGLGSVGNWPLLYQKIYNHLKPGAWFEHVEVDWEPRCDDHTLLPGKLQDWWHRYVRDPYNVVGRSLTFNPRTAQLLEQKGFANVNHAAYRIPMHGWSSLHTERVAGTWWEHAMASGEGRGHGFEALSLAVLTRVQQWPAEHARKLCEEAMLEASNPAIHAYNTLHIYWAQRPPNAPR